MAIRLSEAEYEHLLRRGASLGDRQRQPEKRHKYSAQKVMIDGHTFPSKLEGRCYVDLKWQSFAGLITFPLLQVWFSLGDWLPLGAQKPKPVYYIADFVFVDLQTGCLVVADAKGYQTPEYLRKKAVFMRVYGMPIVELRSRYRRKKMG